MRVAACLVLAAFSLDCGGKSGLATVGADADSDADADADTDSDTDTDADADTDSDADADADGGADADADGDADCVGPWTSERVTADDSVSPAIAIGAVGSVHVFYTRPGHLIEVIHAMRGDEGLWERDTVDTITGGAGLGLFAAAGSDGLLHLTYPSGRLQYAEGSAEDWEVETVTELGLPSDIDVDGSGATYIAFRGGEALRDISCATRGGGAWEVETIAEELFAAPPLLAPRADGSLTVAWLSVPDRDRGGLLMLASNASGEWVTSEPVGEIEIEGGLSMDVDGSDVLALCYASRDGLFCGTASEDDWAFEEVTERRVFVKSVRTFAGTVHVIYYHRFSPGLEYASNTGGAWVSEAIDDASGDGASLVLDAEGHPHVAYASGDGRDREVWYAWKCPSR